MASSPFIRETPPDALKLSVKPGDPVNAPRQYTIENVHGRLQNFDAEYASFGGFFGIHSPNIFAAAPEMVQALTVVRLSNGWRHLSDETQAVIKAALAKAETR